MIFSWTKEQIALWKTTKDLIKQCEQLLDDFNGKRIENFVEIEMLHPKSGNKYWFTIRRAEGMSPAQKNETLTKQLDETQQLLLAIVNTFSGVQWDFKPECLNGLSVREFCEKLKEEK